MALAAQQGLRVGVKPSAAALARPVPARVGRSSTRRAAAAAADAAAAPSDADQYRYRQYDPKDLASTEQDPAVLQLPPGYHWYETMLVLSGNIGDEERDRELAKFEAFLNREQCQSINALVRSRSRLAYPMKGANWEGIYALYTYAARRSTARAVQQLLSNPEAGSEDVLLRFATFCKY